MIKMDWKLKGVDRLAKRLQAIPAAMVKATAGALVEEAEATMTEAKQHYVPRDDGILIASGFVAPPVFQGQAAVTVTLGFGGPAGTGNQGKGREATNREPAGYAVHVHEQTDIFGLTPGGGTRNDSKRAFRGKGRRRKRRKFVGQAKFLETPLQARRAKRAERLAAGIRRRFRVPR